MSKHEADFRFYAFQIRLAIALLLAFPLSAWANPLVRTFDEYVIVQEYRDGVPSNQCPPVVGAQIRLLVSWKNFNGSEDWRVLEGTTNEKGLYSLRIAIEDKNEIYFALDAIKRTPDGRTLVDLGQPSYAVLHNVQKMKDSLANAYIKVKLFDINTPGLELMLPPAELPVNPAALDPEPFPPDPPWNTGQEPDPRQNYAY